MMGMVLAYAMDGVRAARAYVVVILATALIAWAFSEFRNALSTHVPIPYVFDLSTRAYAGVFLGLGVGALSGVLVYEGSSRLISRPLALALGVMVAALGELLAGSVLTYGPQTGWLNARQELMEYLVFSAPPALLALAYGAVVLRQRGLLPARPLSEMFQFWLSAEGNLREAREDVLEARQVISELRSLNYQLAEAKRINDYLLSQSPLAIVQTNRTGRIKFANAAAERLFAATADELTGKPLLPLMARRQGDPLDSLAPMAGATEGRTVLIGAHSACERVAEMLVMDLFDARERPVGYHVSLKDVTAAVQARKKRVVEEKVRGIHRTGQMITHDFSHLLMGLQGAVERAVEGGDRKDLQEAREAVRRGVARGRDLLRQLGAGESFSKPYLVSTDLRALLAEAVEICRSAALDKGIRLSLGAFAACNVNVDTTQMVRVFTNLISNAIGATPPDGEVAVLAQVARNGVTVGVKDNGVGMSPEEIDGAFDPAFSSKGAGGGGLGLAISYLMVDAHGGNLRLESNPEGGLTAMTWLPLAPGLTSMIGDGALLVAVENDRLSEGLIREWEGSGGAAAETRSLDELEAVLHDEPDDWDLVVTDRALAERIQWPDCTVIHFNPSSRRISLLRPGQRSEAHCTGLLRWVQEATVA